MTDATIAAAYDSRAAEYVEVAGSIGQMDAADRALIEKWRDCAPGRLLDAGCGPGLWTDVLHDGHRDVAGIDLSAHFLAEARSRHPHLRFDHGSFCNLPYEGASLGGILAWYSLIHTPPEDIAAVLAEFARVLAPRGSLLIGYFDGAPREPFAHAITEAYFWSADALSELLTDTGFAITATEHRSRAPGEVSKRTHGAITAIRRGN